MKPCKDCIEKHGEQICTSNGCCILEGIPGKSPEEVLHDLDRIRIASSAREDEEIIDWQRR